MRLSSGPEHLLLTNRPVIVTQSDLPSSSPLPLQQRGSPYVRVERRAATVQTKHALLVGASALERAVRRAHHVGEISQAISATHDEIDSAMQVQRYIASLRRLARISSSKAVVRRPSAKYSARVRSKFSGATSLSLWARVTIFHSL